VGDGRWAGRVNLEGRKEEEEPDQLEFLLLRRLSLSHPSPTWDIWTRTSAYMLLFFFSFLSFLWMFVDVCVGQGSELEELVAWEGRRRKNQARFPSFLPSFLFFSSLLRQRKTTEITLTTSRDPPPGL